MSADPLLYQYRTISQQHPHQVALAYLGKLLAYTKGGFCYLPDEPAPIVAPEQYLDTISNISGLLLNAGSMQNVAKSIYSPLKSKSSKHSKVEYVLLSSPDKYFISSPMDTPTGILLFTVSLCPPLSYLWHIYIKLKRITSHIGSPTYPPKFVKLYMSFTPLLKNGYVYESDPFPISNTDEVQCLSLPSSIPGALFVHVILCGARQQSPEDGKYYVAIEHMAFNGVVAGSLAATAMRTLEMSRVGIHMSRTSSVMIHDVMRNHVLNTCNALSKININCYRTISNWATRKLDAQAKEAGGVSCLQLFDNLKQKGLPETASTMHLPTINHRALNILSPSEIRISSVPSVHKNFILSALTNEITREDCENNLRICTSRYCANSLKWIESTLVYIAVEANQFKSRRSKDRMLLQSGQPYFIAKIEYNSAFAKRWNLDASHVSSL
ncbi:hypothetical protein GL50803_003420 [Giardia duodenalis]|uniref:Uncharacterized protein n=1 Tax=Giardia intestinalis (strain ATCC 50803 / WB clone C6) TaxID=184922 RepID=D3KHE0_GIAIC|nr:hypothetical protein GL50803_003420 [Giardia intestinalis]KAE8303922.1 hypothetical protein GL50803_003420 [Giardia intestinalis]